MSVNCKRFSAKPRTASTRTCRSSPASTPEGDRLAALLDLFALCDLRDLRHEPALRQLALFVFARADERLELADQRLDRDLPASLITSTCNSVTSFLLRSLRRRLLRRFLSLPPPTTRRPTAPAAAASSGPSRRFELRQPRVHLVGTCAPSSPSSLSSSSSSSSSSLPSFFCSRFAFSSSFFASFQRSSPFSPLKCVQNDPRRS